MVIMVLKLKLRIKILDSKKSVLSALFTQYVSLLLTVIFLTEYKQKLF